MRFNPKAKLDTSGIEDLRPPQAQDNGYLSWLEPFMVLSNLQDVRERTGAQRAPTPLANYVQARTGGLGELSGGAVSSAPTGGLSAAEQWLVQRESGGKTTAQNKKSTAFGLGQLLVANRRKYLGNDYATTDYAKQLQAMRSYIKDRYGTAEKAVAFWRANGHY